MMKNELEFMGEGHTIEVGGVHYVARWGIVAGSKRCTAILMRRKNIAARIFCAHDHKGGREALGCADNMALDATVLGWETFQAWMRDVPG